MRIEKMHYQRVTIDGEPTVVPTSHMEGADGTWYVFTDTMEDGHEFGIQLDVVPAQELLPVPFERQGQRAMDEYRRKYDVEHS